MTEKDQIAKQQSEKRVQMWITDAQARGLRGYFQRHGSTVPLWRETRHNLRNPAARLTNFGEHCEYWELPNGEAVITDPALAFRIERLFVRLHPDAHPCLEQTWYRQALEMLAR